MTLDGPRTLPARDLVRALGSQPMAQRRGRLVGAVGTSLRVTGIAARIGDTCDIIDPDALSDDEPLQAEVVGFDGDIAILTPLGPLRGVGPAADIIVRGGRDRVPCGRHLLGRVIDAHGRPIDGLGSIARLPDRPVHADAPGPMERTVISARVDTGIRAIDALATLGQGQRLGVFAAAGSGKSTLLAQLARQTRADANVIALIGERGREVREFIEDALGEAGLARSVVIVATADRPAAERVRAAHAATAVAEGLRDEGAHVLLLMDSVTRFARGLRELGLAAGEPAVRRGFPPSVFAELPRLFERAGTAATGAITGIYTVLLEEEDGDPVGEEVRSLLDGHLHLSQSLGARGHFPAIDVQRSLSRLATRLTGPAERQAASALRTLIARRDELQLLVQLGEYRPGADPVADAAMEAGPAIDAFLRQDLEEASAPADTLARLRMLAAQLPQ